MSIPGAGSPLFLATTAGAAAGFSVAKSLRFNSGDSSFLNFTPSLAGNRKTWTWSGWVKRSNIAGVYPRMFGTYTGGSYTGWDIEFTNSDKIDVHYYNGSSYVFRRTTTAVYRDPSAWYHIVVAVDTTQSTANDRLKLYVNGVQVTAFDTTTNVSQNYETNINTTIEHRIGYNYSYSDMYLAEVNFIDGQALAPTDFGKTDDNGVWQAKEVNITSPNDGTVWSNNISGGTLSGYPATNAFDGNTSNFTYAAASSTMTCTFNPPITGTQIEIYALSGGNWPEILVDGAGIGTHNQAWVDVSSQAGGSLSTITCPGASNAQSGFAAVRIDGVILVDNVGAYGTNGFRLPFADNSSTGALGYDAAVTAPTLNPKGGMDVVTYTGNGGAQSISSLAFQPDFVWFKARSAAYSNSLFDSLRGVQKRLKSNSTDAESTDSTALTAFNSNGFTMGGSSSTNNNNSTYVAWCWKAGGAAVANTDGTITSQVSASTAYGFSVVSYSANNAAVTVGHGLDTAPSFIIAKGKNASLGWKIYHKSLGVGGFLEFDNGAFYTFSNYWGSSVNSSTFGVSAGGDIALNDMIAYVWSEVAGFSKFGSYTGNGSTTGPVVTTGFKPRFLLIKRSNSASEWRLFDTARDPSNPADTLLFPDTDEAEATNSSYNTDILADGFQLKNTQGGLNASGGTYVYAAFADRPGNNWTPNNLSAASNNWPNYVYAGGATYSSTETGKNFYTGSGSDLFDGTTSSYVGGENVANGTIYFRPKTAITGVTSIQLYGAYGGETRINGSIVTVSPAWSTSDQYVTIQSPPSSITEISVRGSTGAAARLKAIKVNGSMLVDPGGEHVDSLVDSPSNGTQDDTGIGGEVVGNYATWNPLQKYSAITLSNGNLDFTDSNSSNAGDQGVHATIAPVSGKFYWEMTLSSLAGENYIGISKSDKLTQTLWTGGGVDGYYYYNNGKKIGGGNGNGGTSYGASFGVGDVIGVAVDWDNGKVTFYKNGASQGDAFTGVNLAGYIPAFYFNTNQSASGTINFGQRAFAYSAPTNFKSLNTANLPTPTIADGSKYFDTKLYTGNGGTQSITGYNFSPDFVWLKARNQAYNHYLLDQIRGAGKVLHSNNTDATQNQGDTLTSFNSDGFSLNNRTGVNSNNNTFAAWAWDGGNSNKTYAITVANPGSGNKFYADGALQPTLTLAEGSTYKFDQSNSSNASHPLRFSTTNNGTHGGGSEYTTGVTTAGTPGSAGAFTQIVIAASAPTLYAYCTAHSGMGFQINTSDKGGFTIPAGSLNSTAYDQSATWSGMVSPSPANGTLSQGFNGNLTNTFYGGISAGAYFTFTPTGGITFNTQIRVYNGNVSDTSVKINGGSSVSLSTSSWTTVATGSGTLNTLAITRGTTDVHGWFGIEIDGKLLVDSGVSVANVPSIASQVMASPESGFSIIKYTGNNTSGATVGHGLNAAVEFAIFKQVTVTNDWSVYSKAAGATGYLRLNLRDPFTTTSGQFNNTNPSSSVITLGGDHNANGPSNEIICYAFAPVTGYSSMGSYVGNASAANAPFVYTGFKIRWLLIKGITTNYREWVIYDTARDSYNVANKFLYANSSAAEASGNNIDLLSNGFKPRGGDYTHNKAGETYVYIAIASNPFASNGGLAR